MRWLSTGTRGLVNTVMNFISHKMLEIVVKFPKQPMLAWKYCIVVSYCVCEIALFYFATTTRNTDIPCRNTSTQIQVNVKKLKYLMVA
jgi:hypothetical protein